MGCKDIGITKLEFVGKTQFRYEIVIQMYNVIQHQIYLNFLNYKSFAALFEA